MGMFNLILFLMSGVLAEASQESVSGGEETGTGSETALANPDPAKRDILKFDKEALSAKKEAQIQKMKNFGKSVKEGTKKKFQAGAKRMSDFGDDVNEKRRKLQKSAGKKASSLKRSASSPFKKSSRAIGAGAEAARRSFKEPLKGEEEQEE